MADQKHDLAVILGCLPGAFVVIYSLETLLANLFLGGGTADQQSVTWLLDAATNCVVGILIMLFGGMVAHSVYRRFRR